MFACRASNRNNNIRNIRNNRVLRVGLLRWMLQYQWLSNLCTPFKRPMYASVFNYRVWKESIDNECILFACLFSLRFAFVCWLAGEQTIDRRYNLNRKFSSKVVLKTEWKHKIYFEMNESHRKTVRISSRANFTLTRERLLWSNLWPAIFTEYHSTFNLFRCKILAHFELLWKQTARIFN